MFLGVQLLVVSHEMYEPAHFLGACQWRGQSEEVVLLLSSVHHALSHVLCISGELVCMGVEVVQKLSMMMTNFHTCRWSVVGIR